MTNNDLKPCAPTCIFACEMHEEKNARLNTKSAEIKYFLNHFHYLATRKLPRAFCAGFFSSFSENRFEHRAYSTPLESRAPHRKECHGKKVDGTRQTHFNLLYFTITRLFVTESSKKTYKMVHI